MTTMTATKHNKNIRMKNMFNELKKQLNKAFKYVIKFIQIKKTWIDYFVTIC